MAHRSDPQLQSEPEEVVVVTGAGGMGEAVARRIGSGRRLVLADYFQDTLDRTVEVLNESGYAATGQVTDVSDRASVDRLARTAADAGRLTAVVHTAGVSAATATVEQVLAVDLVGTAHVIDAFEQVSVPGLSLVCVASMAGHHARLTGQQERELAAVPATELAQLPVVRELSDPVQAYILAKRANQVRVQAAALAWNLRGARVNTVSPGVISTAMARAEAAGESGGPDAGDARCMRHRPHGQHRRARRGGRVPDRARFAVRHWNGSAGRRRPSGVDPTPHDYPVVRVQHGESRIPGGRRITFCSAGGLALSSHRVGAQLATISLDRGPKRVFRHAEQAPGPVGGELVEPFVAEVLGEVANDEGGAVRVRHCLAGGRCGASCRTPLWIASGLVP